MCFCVVLLRLCEFKVWCVVNDDGTALIKPLPFQTETVNQVWTFQHKPTNALYFIRMSLWPSIIGSDEPTKQYGGCSQHLYLCVCVCGSCQQVFIEHHPYNEWSASCPAVAQLNVTATHRKEVNEHECTWSQWYSVQSEYLPEALPPHPELQPPPHKTSWQTNTQNWWRPQNDN